MNPEKTERQTDGAESYLSVFSYLLVLYIILLITKQINNDFCVSSAVSVDLSFFFFFDKWSLGLWIRKKEFPYWDNGPHYLYLFFSLLLRPWPCALCLTAWANKYGFNLSPAHADSPKSRNLHFIWAWVGRPIYGTSLPINFCWKT